VHQVIRIEDVTKTYRTGDVQVRALRGVSLVVEDGEMVAIMGASGSGKSTLLHIIGCLDQPTSGRYYLDGRDVSGLEQDALADIRNRFLGFVFQSFNLLPRTSALENVMLPLLYAGKRSNEAARRAEETLRSVGLADRMLHQPSQLSGGQQQRVAIARAVVGGPRVLCADEPTGNLDSRASVEIMALFQRLRADGITTVLVTHEPDIAAYATRTVLVKDGLLVGDEKHEPATARVDQGLEEARNQSARVQPAARVHAAPRSEAK
jgi:putative ABC transport system ATP-binding protein